MTSNINSSYPVYGNPTTASVRTNFEKAYEEITDLQATVTTQASTIAGVQAAQAVDEASISTLQTGLTTTNSNLTTLEATVSNLSGSGASIVSIQTGAYVTSNVSGTADALIASFSPAITSLVHGTRVFVRAAYVNATSTPTFTPNSSSITPAVIVKRDNAALKAGDLHAGSFATLVYDASYAKWVLQNPLTGYGITQVQFDSSSAAATTAFVQRAIGNLSGVNTYSAAGTMSADWGYLVELTGTDAYTLGLPSVANVAAGASLEIVNRDSSSITLTPPSGISLYVNGSSVTSFVLSPNLRVTIRWDGTALLAYPSSNSVTPGSSDNSTRNATTAWTTIRTRGLISVDISTGTPFTLTSGQYAFGIITLTGALTADTTLLFPAQSGRWLVNNQTTGDFTVTATTASATGSGVVLAQDQSFSIWCNGTDIDFATSNYVHTTGDTGAALLPGGTASQRPTLSASSYGIRYNSEAGDYEGWDGTSWGSFGGAVGGGTDKVFYLNDQVVTTDYTIPAGKNAMSAGPVSVNTGVTVSVSDGSVWTIV